jgi:hypothetical protein
MNNSKMKILTLGVLATVVVSSTPVFAATNTRISNVIKTKTTKTIVTSSTNSVSKVSTIPGTMHAAFNYGPNGGPSAQSIISSGGFIQEGDEGFAVRQVQIALNKWLISVGAAPNELIAEDGIFGNGTAYVLYTFQDNVYACGIPDQIVGSKTWAALSPYMMR